MPRKCTTPALQQTSVPLEAERCCSPTVAMSAAMHRNASARCPTVRNFVEPFFNGIKQCRRMATRCGKLAANYPACVELASIRLWPCVNEASP
jgi:hypothetical protein